MDNAEGVEYHIGQTVVAIVEQVLPFGVFVRLPDGTTAYVRKRELTQARNIDPREVVSKGQEIKAEVVALPGRDQNLELSIRKTEPNPWDSFAESFTAQDTVIAEVKSLSSTGAFVQIMPGVDTFIPLNDLAPWEVEKADALLWMGDLIEAKRLFSTNCGN